MSTSRKKSIIQDDDENICYLCGRYGITEVHHIFGGPVRQTCDRRRLTVSLCPGCHEHLHSSSGYDVKDYLHKVGQRVYEDKIGSRQQFIDEFIRSYL